MSGNQACHPNLSCLSIGTTDHRCLEWLDHLKDSNPRLSRWSLAIQPYQFETIYRPGKANINADALSRIDRPRLTGVSPEQGGGV